MTLKEYFAYAWDSWVAAEYLNYRYGSHVSLKEWTDAID